jgi:hypothetical protein
MQVSQYRLGSPSLRDEVPLMYRQQARPYFPDPFLQAIPQVLDQEALEEELFRELPTVSPFLFPLSLLPLLRLPSPHPFSPIPRLRKRCFGSESRIGEKETVIHALLSVERYRSLATLVS